MKRNLIVLSASVVLLSGCSQKAPVIPPAVKAEQPAPPNPIFKAFDETLGLTKKQVEEERQKHLFEYGYNYFEKVSSNDRQR